MSSVEMTGGSYASDAVMELVGNPLSSSALTLRNVLDNYASSYPISTPSTSQTGGGSTDKLKSFVNRLVNNRVFDLYMKWLGISTLTPATLVPFALLSGTKIFQSTISKMMKDEKAGKFSLSNLPIIDEPLLGNYLKIAGFLGGLSFTPQTLIPLGLAMAIYEFYNSKTQTGGASELGATLLCGTGGCGCQPPRMSVASDFTPITGTNVLDIKPFDPSASMETNLLPSMTGGRRSKRKRSRSRKQKGAGSDWALSQYSRGPINNPDQSLNDFRRFTTTGQYLSAEQLAPGVTSSYRPTSGSTWTTLYDASPYAGTPTGYNISGLSTSLYKGGSKKRHSKKKKRSSKSRKH